MVRVSASLWRGRESRVDSGEMRARTQVVGRFLAALLGVAGACATSRASVPVNTGSDAALQLLRDGNSRFAGGLGSSGDERARVAMTGESVSPFAVVLTSSDSRVPAEQIFDRGVGDVYVLRMPVVVVDDAVLWGVNYAARELGVPLVLVLVPTRCDVLSALDAMPESMSGSRRAMAEAVDRARLRVPSGGGRAYTMALGEELAWKAAEDLLSGGKSVARRVREKRLRIEAALYDVDTGVVSFVGGHPREGELVERAIYRDALERAGVKELSPESALGILGLAEAEGVDAGGDEGGGVEEEHRGTGGTPVPRGEERVAVALEPEGEPMEIEKPGLVMPTERLEEPETTFSRAERPVATAKKPAELGKPVEKAKTENTARRRETESLAWVWWVLGGLVAAFCGVWFLMRDKPGAVAGRVGPVSGGGAGTDQDRRQAA